MRAIKELGFTINEWVARIFADLFLNLKSFFLNPLLVCQAETQLFQFVSVAPRTRHNQFIGTNGGGISKRDSVIW